jgi:hypothetical protein
VLLFNLFAYPEERQLAESITGQSHHADSSSHLPGEFFFDQTFAPFLKYGVPAHHFVAESTSTEEEADGHNDPCSLALGIFNMAGCLDDFRENFLPKFRTKYELTSENNQVEQMEADSNLELDDGQHEETVTTEATSFGDIIDARLSAPLNFSESFLTTYQSMVEIRWPADGSNLSEAVSVRRLLHCISASLALNGLFCSEILS